MCTASARISRCISRAINLGLILAVILALIGVTAEVSMASRHSYEESGTDFIAPERGFYKYFRLNKYGYPEYVDLANDRDFSWVRQSGFSLIAARVSLEKFRDHDIPESFLAQLQSGFDAVRAGGVKVILRFTYNNSSKAGEDASLPWILRHISQLQDILRTNTDVIAVVQAGFLGAWGEWHSSRHGLDTPEARRAVVQALLEVLPQERSVQLRYPQHKEDLFGPPLLESAAYGDSFSARTGHHNDCLFASDNDYTYPLKQIDHYSNYVALDGPFVPVGGETCRRYPPRTNCATARSELRRLHYSYLNNNYLQEVIDGWRREGCYDEIASHLGYRLVLREATFPETVSPGNDIAVKLALENLGWAAPFNHRALLLTLVSGTGDRIETTVMPDARRIRPGATTMLEGTFRITPAMKGGNYTLYLSAPDPAPRLRSRNAYAMPFYNVTYQEAEARLPLGQVTIGGR